MQQILQFCLMLRKNRKSRHFMAQFKAAMHREEAPTMVLDIFVRVPCPALPCALYGPPIRELWVWLQLP